MCVCVCEYMCMYVYREGHRERRYIRRYTYRVGAPQTDNSDAGLCQSSRGGCRYRGAVAQPRPHMEVGATWRLELYAVTEVENIYKYRDIYVHQVYVYSYRVGTAKADNSDPSLCQPLQQVVDGDVGIYKYI